MTRISDDLLNAIKAVVRDAIREVLAERADKERWKTIDAAPANGVRFWGYSAISREQGVAWVRDRGLGPTFERAQRDLDTRGWAEEYPPTHWRPLPETMRFPEPA